MDGERRPDRALFYAVYGFAFAVTAIALGAAAWLLGVYPSRAASTTGAGVSYTVDRQTNLVDVGRDLARLGVVPRPEPFVAYLRLMGADSRLRVGRPVWLEPGSTPRQLARQIAFGFGPSRTRVTFPEGFDRYAMARRAEEHGVCSRLDFLDASEDPELLGELGIVAKSAEGYLFPDTYETVSGGDCRELVRRMVRTFRRRTMDLFAAAYPRSKLRRLRWGRHEVVTMASIVEKEAAVAVEQGVIAGVFLNRLTSESFQPKRLQADPTVRYGCVRDPGLSDACRSYDGRITRAMLQDTSNPYNTYRHEGLPPGPICNPGLSAIRSVLAPQEHSYFYFVAKGAGRHQFSETLEEHNAAVDRYLR